MPPNSILEIRQVINNTLLGDVMRYAEQIMASSDPEQQETLLETMNDGVDSIMEHDQDAYSTLFH